MPACQAGSRPVPLVLSVKKHMKTISNIIIARCFRLTHKSAGEGVLPSLEWESQPGSGDGVVRRVQEMVMLQNLYLRGW